MSTTISGTTGIDKVQDGTTINASSIIGALNATGSAPIYACRAWVNFNGTGTVAIRASGNVSSITDNGTGDYTVNFTTAMSDVNYSLSGTSGTGTSTTSGNNRIVINAGQTTGGQRLNIQRADTGSMDDISYNNIAIFR